MKQILRYYSNINVVDFYKKTTFMFFAFLESNVEKLFYFDVKINNVNCFDQTIFYIVVCNEKSRVAQCFLIKNIDVFIKNCQKYIVKLYILTNNEQFLQRFTQ